MVLMTMTFSSVRTGVPDARNLLMVYNGIMRAGRRSFVDARARGCLSLHF